MGDTILAGRCGDCRFWELNADYSGDRVICEESGKRTPRICTNAGLPFPRWMPGKPATHSDGDWVDVPSTFGCVLFKKRVAEQA